MQIENTPEMQIKEANKINFGFTKFQKLEEKRANGFENITSNPSAGALTCLLQIERRAVFPFLIMLSSGVQH